MTTTELYLVILLKAGGAVEPNQTIACACRFGRGRTLPQQVVSVREMIPAIIKTTIGADRLAMPAPLAWVHADCYDEPGGELLLRLLNEEPIG
jgi:hypothetical protein